MAAKLERSLLFRATFWLRVCGQHGDLQQVFKALSVQHMLLTRRLVYRVAKYKCFLEGDRTHTKAENVQSVHP